MKINLKIFLAHTAIILLSLLVLFIFVITAPILGEFTTHIVVRAFISILILFIYVYVGAFISLKNKYNIFSSSMIIIIGSVLWLYTYWIGAKNLFEIPEELSVYWIPYNTYYLPFTFIYFLLNIKFTPFIGVISNLLLPILMWVGAKYSKIITLKLTKC